MEVNFNYIKKENNSPNNKPLDPQIEKEADKDQNSKGEKINSTSDYISVSNKTTTVELPCRIGGMAWCIRNYCGAPQPMQGIIHEMSFDHSMQLIISVYHIGKGVWGKKVFATEEEAWEAIRNRKKKQQKPESE